METFFWNTLTSIISSLMAVVLKGLMIWWSKWHKKSSPVLCDGYVKNEETKIDRLVAILKTNNWGGDAGGDGPCNTAYSEYSKQPASSCWNISG